MEQFSSKQQWFSEFRECFFINQIKDVYTSDNNSHSNGNISSKNFRQHFEGQRVHWWKCNNQNKNWRQALVTVIYGRISISCTSILINISKEIKEKEKTALSKNNDKMNIDLFLSAIYIYEKPYSVKNTLIPDHR